MSTALNGHILLPNEIDFSDLTPIEVPVRIGKESFILREASGATVSRYERMSLREAEMSFTEDGGTRVLRNLGGMAGNEAEVLSQCLYRADKDGRLILNSDGDADPQHLIPARKIGFWKAAVQKRLWEKLLEISPELSSQETLEVLTKQRDKLNDKIARLQARDPKKLLPGGTDGSALATS